MPIQNHRHVKALRDVIHGAIQQFAASYGIGEGGLSGHDLTVALAWVLRDVIKDAPEPMIRAELAAGARYALDDAASITLDVPRIVQ